MDNFSQALELVAVGIGGVFANLFVLMLVLIAIGKLFGKKKNKPA
ncbi:MAG: OadG family protein [bacterium]